MQRIPFETARISECELVLYEVAADQVQRIIEIVFNEMEEGWGAIGSPFQRWYRVFAAGSGSLKMSSADGRLQGRLIAWKTCNPFQPENIFFRTIDSSRLLPMHLADIRVQFYAHRSRWEHIDSKREEGGRNAWKDMTLKGIMHELLLLRNIHDTGGADIPVIVTNWDAQGINLVLNYWAELSKGKWSEAERKQKYDECDRSFCRRILPCFPQVDLLVRSLLSDPEVGYVPPFIILLPCQASESSARATALFTDPSYCPSKAIVDSFPKTCGAPTCIRENCGFFDLKASRSLSAGSTMVRKRENWPAKRIVCNMWGCEIQDLPEEGTQLQRCQRCKETLYCDRIH